MSLNYHESWSCEEGMLSHHKHPSDEYYAKQNQDESDLEEGSQDHRGQAVPSTS